MKNKNVFFPNFSIGENVYSEVEELCNAYGKKVVFIGGKTALEKAKGIEKELSSNIQILDKVWYGGESSYENVDKLKENKNVQKADLIFVFGGGKAIDTCKVLSDKMKKPLFSFPTIASTCASVTAVCAMYTQEGEFYDLYMRDKPAEHTFINTRIIAEAPLEYLWAGIGDTIAKAYEPEFSSRNNNLDYYNSLGVEISKLCKNPIIKHGEKAMECCEKNKCSEDLEEVILSIIVNTGLVSNLVINDYNSCVAHSMCYGFTAIEKVEKNHLHGEIVSYGVLVQLMMDEKKEELKELIEFYKKIKLPISYKEFDVNNDEIKKVLKKALSVNDIKVAAFEINEKKLSEAIDNLEEINK